MQVRDYIQKNQASFGFAAALVGAVFCVEVAKRSLVWLPDKKLSFLLGAALVSAMWAIVVVATVSLTYSWIIKRGRPRGQRNRYPPVTGGQVLDLYLRFMATGACTLPVAFLGLITLRDHHLLHYRQYVLIALLSGCIPGWVAWIVTGRWLRSYPEF
jgi:hypothetical protein